MKCEIVKYKHEEGNISPGIMLLNNKGRDEEEYLSSHPDEKEVILFPFTFVKINFTKFNTFLYKNCNCSNFLFILYIHIDIESEGVSPRCNVSIDSAMSFTIIANIQSVTRMDWKESDEGLDRVGDGWMWAGGGGGG